MKDTLPDLLICGPLSFFPDDVAAVCADCGGAIVHRPHVPPGLVRVCVRCAEARLAAEAGAGATPRTFAVTPETVLELELFAAPVKGGIH